MGAFVKILAQFWFGYTSIASADERLIFYRNLAEYHAPAVIHQVGKNPKADIPVRYDFDGDLFADNNWENLEKYNLSPAAYYDVIETKTHYFITYGFFHPRDYTNFWFCVSRLCHENDFEGAILTVRKDESYGKLEFIEALAHLSISGGPSPYTYVGNSKQKTGVVQRAVLRIETGGHGIHLWNGDYPNKYELFLPDDDTSQPRIDKLPNHYELYSMAEIWDMKNEKEIERIFKGVYDFKGDSFEIKNLPRSFAGKKFGSGLASLPWAWSEFGAKKGEWFLDPAKWVKKKLKNPINFSSEYVYHPYKDVSLTPTP